MRTTYDFKTLLRGCSMLALRNFERLADMTSEQDISESSMNRILNDVKTLEDLLFSLTKLYKCEMDYTDTERENMNKSVERVTANLLLSAAWGMDSEDFKAMIDAIREQVARNKPE